MNNATIFDDVADGVMVAAKLINQMLPAVHKAHHDVMTTYTTCKAKRSVHAF